MLYIFIRTCIRDDYISRLAYESIKCIYPNAYYMFLCENGEYKYSNIEEIVYREKCDNFGGQFGAKGLIKNLKFTNISPNDKDVIFIVDSDIVMFKDVLSLIDDDTHHAGVINSSRWGLKHISGQFQIVSGFLFKKLISMSIDDIDRNVKEMLNSGMDIADDTFISFISDKLSLKKQNVSTWVHQKFYEYSNNLDFMAVITDVRKRYSTL
jgi:hypothetical protein